MARITVEDCIDKFPSRFELVLIASNRARKLHSGENPTVEKDNDKNTVIALREIAQESVPINDLKNDLIEEYQTVTFSEDEELNEITENEKTEESLLEDSTSILEENIEEANLSENSENNIQSEVENNAESENNEDKLDTENSED